MKMKILMLILSGWLLLSVFPVIADEITMSSAQPEYYFQVGSDAQVPFTIESTFKNTLVGTLQYSLTRHENNGGFSLSQTSTQSQSFPVGPGRSNHALTLTSETETDYDLSLLLMYESNGKDYAVVLPPLSVHFVHDTNITAPQQKTVRSTTSEATKTPPSSQMDPFEEMEQQMQQMRQEQQNLMQKFMSQSLSGTNSRPASPSQNPSQALQNNQMASSSSALQQQMMQESQQNEENKKKLAESLEKDPLIREQASDMKRAGYNQTSGRIVPKGPDSGEVSISFENENGEKITVTGTAEKNQITSLTAEKSGEIPVPPALSSNATWNDSKEHLSSHSMTPTSGKVIRTPNETVVEQQFQSPDGRNASLSARIINGTVQEVTLKQDEEFPIFWLIGIFLFILLVILCAGVAWWYYSTRPEVKTDEAIRIPTRNVKEEVREMLETAERTYHAGMKKEGYDILGQAIRLHISHTFGNGDALTNEEIISHAPGLSLPANSDVIDILRSCSLVEYAKEEPRDEQFFSFLSKSQEIIARE
ncbi:MAG TPA: hypothetical protein PLY78_08015 [Methanospirillum sp.]|nr:hypothetical protein [Methanospirillum sp.]